MIIHMNDTFAAAKELALKLLSSKRRSSGELRKAIQERYNADVASEIELWAKEYKFIDDADYAKSFVFEKCNSLSKNYIYHTLTQRGVDLAAITKAFDEIAVDERKVLTKLFREALRGDYSKKNVLKIARSLARKGFEYEDIESLVYEYAKDDETERTIDFEI